MMASEIKSRTTGGAPIRKPIVLPVRILEFFISLPPLLTLVNGIGPVLDFGTCRSHQQSSNSRKHKVFIGLVKYQPEMEMNEIRKRQSQRAPAPMFLVISSGEQLSVACGRSGSGKGHWGLMKYR
ncbi:hypothetical protein D8674_026473 [Pyrus ussuriensis x Pyrus communis]|uniref:Uncharacterized protein n=1 Tax=Pyrus ussuriensis x Pyrus communis TaxID=2448454 RepID=A0A5N5I875_9ROSA|nr:hypothetical protein D8674_026473 [Pyrus ussuriensis x Pyrus communis]